ncbi:hypothetical protein [Chitinimonas sp.]|uniref:hypothetical protein n=1 Tax=Chitinimonas sp. TaxID=1934313 RepID=UPI0035B3D0F1
MARWRSLLVILALLGLAFYGYHAAGPAKPSATVQCADLTAPCQVHLAGQALQLQADQSPRALKGFKLTLRGASAPFKVRFGMVGMEMGPVAFRFVPAADGAQHASVMLPFCVQGRRDWWLLLESDTGSAMVAFTAH